jgi:hypothetical protein
MAAPDPKRTLAMGTGSNGLNDRVATPVCGIQNHLLVSGTNHRCSRWPPMPLYYFNLRTQGALELDPEGIDLPDLPAAENAALEGAREIMAERLRHGEPMNGSQFEVADESGRTVHILKFTEALT